MKNLKSGKPTKIWKERMSNRATIFTGEIIQETELILDEFIDELIQLNGTPSKDEIMAVVESTVSALNDLDEKYDHFIETDEREELWEFIDKAAREAGLEIEDGKYITEAFLEW